MKCIGAGMKELLWIGNALKDLRDLPTDIKREIGFDLDLLQRGLEPRDFKPISTVGKGTLEIRVRDDEGNIGRCFYVTTRRDKLVVLHSFVKKSQKTSKADLEKGQVRYKMMQQLLK
jgi:phage-related protein